MRRAGLPPGFVRPATPPSRSFGDGRAAGAGLWLWLGALALGWTGADGAARAQAGASSASAEVVVLWLQPAPQDLLDRIHGQLSDLNAVLVPTVLVPPRRLQQVRDAARSQGARAAVWVERLEGGGYRLHLYDASEDLSQSRDFGVTAGEVTGTSSISGTSDTSATVEALAIACRAALRTMLSRNDPGESVADTTTVVPPASTRAPSRAVRAGRSRSPASASSSLEPGSPHGPHPQAEDAAAPASESASARPPAGADDALGPDPASAGEATGDSPGTDSSAALVLRAGWELGADGLGLSQGPSAGAGARFGRFGLDAVLSGVLEREVSVGDVRVSVRAHRIDVLMRMRVVRVGPVEFDVASGAGLLLLRRATLDAPPGLDGTGSARTQLTMIRAGLGLNWTPGVRRGLHFGVDGRLGCAVPLAPLTLRVQGPSKDASRGTWRVQPLASLGLWLRF